MFGRDSRLRLAKQTLIITALVAFASCGDPDAMPMEESEETPSGNLPGGKADGEYDDPESQRLDWDAIAARCGPEQPGDPIVAQTHFAWNQPFEEMEERYWALYEAPNRLHKRAFYDQEAEKFLAPIQGDHAVLSRRLIENLTAHIEKALSLGYVDYIFFSDMGHSHFFIPLERWSTVYAPMPPTAWAYRYTEMFEDPTLRILYHTAEQLLMLDEDKRVFDDKRTQWRYYTRNIVGDNDGKGVLDIIHNFGSQANTAHDYAGHRYYGAGFYFGANHQGCFPFRHDGETYYYDFSLEFFPMNE